MKNIFLILISLLISSLSFAQKNSILYGEWYNAKENIIITLSEVNQTIYSEITWMKFPNDVNGKVKTDLLNPDISLRANKIIGLIMMSNFSHIAGNVWDNGTIYIAKEGKKYSGMMKLKDTNTLYLKGYVGFSFFERYSSTWKRVLYRGQFRDESKYGENLLTQLKADLMKIIELIENISLKPAEEILQKVEKENLLIKLQEDLSIIIKKIEKIKKVN